MARRSLRVRIGLTFAAFAIGTLAVVALGLWLGYRQSGGDPNGFWTAGIVAAFGLAGLSAAIWLFFDARVARPLARLAADLRVRAETDLTAEMDVSSLSFLGEVAGAVGAISTRLSGHAATAEERLASETAHLRSEREMLVAVLSGVPLAVLIVGEDHRITLYDGQAAELLEPVRPLCLGQSVFVHVDEGQLTRALAALGPDEMAPLKLSTSDGTHVLDATLRRFGAERGYMLSMDCAPDTRAERPLAFDAGGLVQRVGDDLRTARLTALPFVIFDTETTGLLPDRDAVVQIGAVRAMGTRLVDGESFSILVNPGRPIPGTSSAVHGITDAMVADAPPMREAGTRFLHFAEGAVLVAHNAPFDMAFIRRHAAETGAALAHPVLDTVLFGAELFGSDEALTLDAIAARLGVEIAEEARHTALGDARATAAVFLRMLEVFGARGCTTLGDLLAVQERHTHILPDLNAKPAPTPTAS